MNKLSSEKLNSYISIANIYFKEDAIYAKSLLELRSSKDPQKEVVEDVQFKRLKFLYNEMIQIKQECIELYVNELIKFVHIRDEWFSDLKESAVEKNLYMIDVVWESSYGLPLLSSEIDIFLMNFLIDYFKESDVDKIQEWISKNLFESVLDTAERGLEEYTVILSELLNLNKPDEWYKNFTSQMKKMIDSAPISKVTFHIVKAGNSFTKTSEEMKEYVNDYLCLYIEEGFVDNNLNWID